MSLDLSLVCGCCESEVFEWNFTYNYSQMWHTAMPDRERLVDVDGLTGAESLPLLRQAVQVIEDDFATYRALNPENGWGTARKFLGGLRECAVAAARWPKAKWEGCR